MTSIYLANRNRHSSQHPRTVCTIFRHWSQSICLVTIGSLLFIGSSSAGDQPKQPPFPLVKAKAFYIPPETTTEESGYFSLCEGRNGKIYIGTAAYGRNAFLVEFDPAT
ncbi:MAG: hypothetical protein RIS70_3976, partial [Planctomycetota bacterium]